MRALSGLQGQGSAAPAGGPLSALSTLGQYAQVQNSLNQNKLFQQTFAARQRAGQIIAASPDLDTAVAAMYKDPIAAVYAPTAANEIRTYQQIQLNMAKTKTEGVQAGLQGFLKMSLGPQGMDEGTWNTYKKAALDAASPEFRQPMSAAIDDYRKALTGNIDSSLPQEQQVQRYLQNAGGVMVGNGIDAEKMFGGIVNQPLGNRVGTGVNVPAFYGPQAGLHLTGQYGMGLGAQVVTKNLPGGATQPSPVGGSNVDQPPGSGPLNLSLNPTPSAQPNAAPSPGGNRAPGPLATGAPSGGPGGGSSAWGVPSPTQVQQSYNQGRGTGLATDQGELDNTVHLADQNLKVVQELRDVLPLIKTNGLAPYRTKLANIIDGLGGSPDLVDKIGNGSQAASQEAIKLLMTTTVSQAEQQLPVGSHFGFKQLQAFTQANPDISTQQGAIDKIFNFWTNMRNSLHDEQSSRDKFLSAGGDITMWPSIWADKAAQKGYFSTKSTQQPNGVPPVQAPKPSGRSADEIFQ